MHSAASRLTSLLPGLALVAGLTAVAYLIATLPGIAVLGPLVIALVVGLAWRALLGPPRASEAGATFSARTLLRIGIVLLGVRLDFGLLAQVGPIVLLGSLLVVAVGILGIERLGALAGLPRGLRLGIAVGTSICGASAILAAVPTTRMKDAEAGVAVGIISVLGTAGVLGFALFSSLLEPAPAMYGLLVGLTLQEVAQVLAAGYVPGAEAGDLATIVKLTRVALLAPALLVLGGLLGRNDDARSTGALDSHDDAKPSGLLSHRSGAEPTGARRFRSPLPLFLLGFLAVGVISSLGWIPATLSNAMEAGSLLLTSAAMVGLGLGLDLAVFGRVGSKALLVGAGGFLGLVAVMLPYAVLVTR